MLLPSSCLDLPIVYTHLLLTQRSRPVPFCSRVQKVLISRFGDGSCAIFAVEPAIPCPSYARCPPREVERTSPTPPSSIIPSHRPITLLPCRCSAHPPLPCSPVSPSRLFRRNVALATSDVGFIYHIVLSSRSRLYPAVLLGRNPTQFPLPVRVSDIFCCLLSCFCFFCYCSRITYAFVSNPRTHTLSTTCST